MPDCAFEYGVLTQCLSKNSLPSALTALDTIAGRLADITEERFGITVLMQVHLVQNFPLVGIILPNLSYFKSNHLSTQVN